MNRRKSEWGPKAEWHRPLGEWLYGLERHFTKEGDADKRLRLRAKAVARQTRLHGPDGERTAAAQSRLANELEQLGRLDEAVALRRQLLDACRRHLGRDHWWTLTGEMRLAQDLERSGERNEAKALATHVLEVKRRTVGADHRDTEAVSAFLDALDAELQTRTGVGTEWRKSASTGSHRSKQGTPTPTTPSARISNRNTPPTTTTSGTARAKIVRNTKPPEAPEDANGEPGTPGRG
jgi:Tetratricopeptide repeat